MTNHDNNALPELHMRHIGGGLLALFRGDELVREIGVTPGWDFKDRDEVIVAFNNRRASAGREAVAGKIVAYRLHTPDNRWQWMDGTPPIGTLDLWKSYGWKLEYAYAGPDHAERQSAANELPKQGEGGRGSVGAEDDAWKVGMFDRWNAYAQQLGYTGMCDALSNIPELHTLAKKAEGV